jgi:hypothetical protein
VTVSLSYYFEDDSWPPQAAPGGLNRYPDPEWFNDGFAWEAGEAGHPGVWTRHGPVGYAECGARFNNIEYPPFSKWVWIQIVYKLSEAAEVGFELEVPDGVTRTALPGGGFVDLGDGWTRYTRMYLLEPQPAWERFVISVAIANADGFVSIDSFHFGCICDVTQLSSTQSTTWSNIKAMYR